MSLFTWVSCSVQTIHISMNYERRKANGERDIQSSFIFLFPTLSADCERRTATEISFMILSYISLSILHGERRTAVEISFMILSYIPLSILNGEWRKKFHLWYFLLESCVRISTILVFTKSFIPAKHFSRKMMGLESSCVFDLLCE